MRLRTLNLAKLHHKVHVFKGFVEPVLDLFLVFYASNAWTEDVASNLTEFLLKNSLKIFKKFKVPTMSSKHTCPFLKLNWWLALMEYQIYHSN